MVGYLLASFPLSIDCCIIRLAMCAHKKYTPGQLAELSALYAHSSLKEVASAWGISTGAAHHHLHMTGAKKPFRAYIPMKPVTLSRVELAYVAGLIDGEGTVTVKRVASKWKPLIHISNTSPVLMDWLADRIPPPSARIVLQRTQTLTRAAAYVFELIGFGWLPLFKALLPYLVIKRDRMALLIEWAEHRLAQNRLEPLTERHLAIVAMIRELNMKPSSRLSVPPSSPSLSTTSRQRVVST